MKKRGRTPEAKLQNPALPANFLPWIHQNRCNYPTLTFTRHSTFHDREHSTRLLASLLPINCPRHHTRRVFHRTFSDLFARNSFRRISSRLRVTIRLHLPAHEAATILSNISLSEPLASFLIREQVLSNFPIDYLFHHLFRSQQEKNHINPAPSPSKHTSTAQVTMAAAGLLARQLKEMQKGKDLQGISCGLINDNVFEWEVMLMINDDCKYYGGKCSPRSPRGTSLTVTPQEVTSSANCPSQSPTLSCRQASPSRTPSHSTQTSTRILVSCVSRFFTHPWKTNTAMRALPRGGVRCRRRRRYC